MPPTVDEQEHLVEGMHKGIINVELFNSLQNLLVTENQDSFLNIGISGFAVLTSGGVRSNAT